MPKSAWLIPISGPAIPAIELVPKTGGVVMGRHENADLKLPVDADRVSRFHARFNFDGQSWRVQDLKSSWGTFVNGVKLVEGHDLPLTEGDLVRVSPWTFSLSSTAARRGLQVQDDTQQMQTMVRSFSPDAQQRALADELLTLLLEGAAAIHAAQDEKELSQAILDVAARGTGLPHAAMLRPLDSAGKIEVIATRAGVNPTGGGALYSRSLIQTASTGVVAELSGDNSSDNLAISIVQMKIDAAICVPLMLGQTVAAYLYLDSRGSGMMPGQAKLRASASAFCLALGRMASLALANLKRIEMERRAATLDAELRAGAEAQRWILPPRSGKFGAVTYMGQSRPGQFLGGDFFDVISLDNDRLAIALGDVCGKGIPASVLMTAAQGFLHAALSQHGDPGRAVTDLNRFVCPRRPESKFITMWVGVFDLKNKTLTYVDAGHGYGQMINPGGTFNSLRGGENVPVGVLDEHDYEVQHVPLPPGGAVIVVSDGFVEQFTPTGVDGSRRQFDLKGVQDAYRTIGQADDEMTVLFDALIAHAGTTSLSDDATAIILRWN